MKRGETKHGRCAACGKPISATYASTRVHSQACGHLLACRLVVAVPGVIDLLPPEWRPDLATSERERKRLAAKRGEPALRSVS